MLTIKPRTQLAGLHAEWQDGQQGRAADYQHRGQRDTRCYFRRQFAHFKRRLTRKQPLYNPYSQQLQMPLLPL